MTLSEIKNSQNRQSPRLKPIENPESLQLKVAYWITKQLMGKVITPLKVHYARFPEALGLANKIRKTDEKIEIEPRLKNLIKVYVATINGCAFCIDLSKAMAQKQNIEKNLYDDILRFEESSKFKDSEKAALAFVDQTTRKKQVDESTFQRLESYFDERQIVQITLLNAIENFYNLMNTPMNIDSDEFCELISEN